MQGGELGVTEPEHTPDSLAFSQNPTEAAHFLAHFQPDNDLQAVIRAWPSLDVQARSAILGIVRLALGGGA